MHREYQHRMWMWIISWLCASATAAAALVPATRFADVVTLSAAELAPFHGQPIEHLALLACANDSCRPIPFQIDARDADGQWVLDQGPEASHDPPAGVLGGNDVLLFMATDAGDRAHPTQLPGHGPVSEIALRDPRDDTTGWAYLVGFDAPAPRAATSYVGYDAAADRMHGARVTLGFSHGLPTYLAVADPTGDGEVNLLDRLKVRASATFLWGLLHFARNEGDLSEQFVGWKAGPIRVIRHQRQWVRIGWGIRSPTFGSYTYFYRDFAELPVGLRLNFPPRYFIGDIVVRTILDFRDLRGWSVLTPSSPAALLIDGTTTAAKKALNQSTATWFALLGPRLTLVQTMDVSASLMSVRRRLLYREDPRLVDPPEATPGELPGIGFSIDQWDHVGAGVHQLTAISYALPPGIDAREFVAARTVPLQVTAQPLR